MILNDGMFRGKRFLSKRTIDLFSRPQVRDLEGNGLEGEARGLGWITKCNNTNAGDLCSNSVICHTGFTGTNVVIDRENGFGYTLLSNRVHPTRANNKVIRFRSLLANYLYSHLEETLTEIRWIDDMKYKYVNQYNREGYVNFYGSKELVKVPNVYVNKKEESRGVWFSTVENIDLIPTDNSEAGIKKALKNIKETARHNCIIIKPIKSTFTIIFFHIWYFIFTPTYFKIISFTTSSSDFSTSTTNSSCTCNISFDFNLFNLI